MSPSWWPSGWKIASRLKQLRLPRIEVLLIAAACVVAFVITLSVLASRAGQAQRAAEQARETRRPAAPAPLTAADLALGEDDFVLPPFTAPVLQPSYEPFRPRRARWTAEEAAKYWVSPRQIATDLVQSENDRAIQQLFQDVP